MTRWRVFLRALIRPWWRVGVVALVLVPLVGTTVVLAQRRVTGGAALFPSAPQSISLNCPSPSLGGALPALVYLPSGYKGSAKRYPVIYFLHGLPANPGTYETNGFVAASVVADRAPAIVVTPQGARSAGADREYLDWGAGEDWPAAISHDLVTCIDKRYRTIPSRDGRALMGVSAGGYGAFNIGLRSLDVFGAVESWSGYFEATNPAGTAILNLGSTAAQQAATVPNNSALAATLAQYPSYIAFFVGDQDTRFLQDNRDYDRQLTAAGVAHSFAVYHGGHTYSLWRSQAPAWLANALRYLARTPHQESTGVTGSAGPSGPTGTAQ